MAKALAVFFLFLALPLIAFGEIIKPDNRVVHGLLLRTEPNSTSTAITVLWPKYGDYGFLLDDTISRYYKVESDGIEGYVSKSYSHEDTSINEKNTTTPEKDEMTIQFVNVGQGDATLIEFQCGAALIDLGGENGAAFNSTNRLKRYIDQFFARRSVQAV